MKKLSILVLFHFRGLFRDAIFAPAMGIFVCFTLCAGAMSYLTIEELRSIIIHSHIFFMHILMAFVSIFYSLKILGHPLHNGTLEQEVALPVGPCLYYYSCFLSLVVALILMTGLSIAAIHTVLLATGFQICTFEEWLVIGGYLGEGIVLSAMGLLLSILLRPVLASISSILLWLLGLLGPSAYATLDKNLYPWLEWVVSFWNLRVFSTGLNLLSAAYMAAIVAALTFAGAMVFSRMEKSVW